MVLAGGEIPRLAMVKKQEYPEILMTLALLFWMLMILSFIFGAWSYWPAPTGGIGLKPLGVLLLVYVLLAILGWAQFGAAVHR